MPTRTARLLARGNGHTIEEEEEILRQRNRDIEIGGFARAFGVPSFEKHEYLNENNMLRGKF